MTNILDLSDLLYNYERDISHTNQTNIKNSIITILTENQMTPFYKYLCDKYKWSLDETLLSSLRSHYFFQYSSCLLIKLTVMQMKKS